MIIRKSSKGYNIVLYRNSTPGVTRIKTYHDGNEIELTYPTSYKYFITIDDSIVKRTNSWETAEVFYTEECEKKGYTSHGRAIVGEHVMLGQIITIESEFPDSINTKSEIKDFMDLRNIKYKSNDTKSTLLANIDVVNPWKAT